MCIIVVKPSGVNVPSNKTLENCFRANPHGAGMMWVEEGKVHISKGFMHYEGFKTLLKDVRSRVDEVETPMIFHFRISTTGSVSAGNCHPFPVCQEYRSMKKAEVVCDLGMAHNGIIAATSNDSDCRGFDVSDTMVFVKKYVAPLARISGGYSKVLCNDDMVNLMAKIADSKLAFLDKKGRIQLRGQFNQYKGCYYSNYSYSTYSASYYDRYGKYNKYGNEWKNRTYASAGKTDAEKYSKQTYLTDAGEEDDFVCTADADDYGLTSLKFSGMYKLKADGVEVDFEPYECALDPTGRIWTYWSGGYWAEGKVSKLVTTEGEIVTLKNLAEVNDRARSKGTQIEKAAVI